MTWSGLRSSGVLTGAYTLVYVTRQYSRASLSNTRHTSFYATIPGCYRIHTSFYAAIPGCYRIHTSFYATIPGCYRIHPAFMSSLGLILGFATYFFSIKIFLVIKLYTITTAVAPTLVII